MALLTLPGPEAMKRIRRIRQALHAGSAEALDSALRGQKVVAAFLQSCDWTLAPKRGVLGLGLIGFIGFIGFIGLIDAYRVYRVYRVYRAYRCL